MKRRLKISSTDLERIEKAVKTAESKTSGEIVPSIVFQSDAYLWSHFAWALLGWILVSMALEARDMMNPFGTPLWLVQLGELIGIVLGFFVPWFPVIKRITVPRGMKAYYAHEKALASFVTHNLHRTRDRTGILIYFSILERRIEILADSGISEKLPKDYWQKQVNTLIDGIHAGEPVSILVKVIETIGEDLAKHFPRLPDDTNELSDRVRLDDEGR